MKRRPFLAMSVVALLSCKRRPVTFVNTDLTGANFGRQLALLDHHGQMRSLADFQGKATVVFFGYTACPDICPTMLAKLADVMKVLGSDAERVQVLFVTLDPQRDSAERLKDFVPSSRISLTIVWLGPSPLIRPAAMCLFNSQRFALD